MISTLILAKYAFDHSSILLLVVYFMTRDSLETYSWPYTHIAQVDKDNPIQDLEKQPKSWGNQEIPSRVSLTIMIKPKSDHILATFKSSPNPL